MAKLTVNGIRKQIAALEAKAARIAEEETKSSVSKVRALMNELGVTLEHLSAAVGRKGAAVKKALVGSKAKPTQRAAKGAPKYRDPETGATWTGFGRAPGWIAGVADRDAFLVSKGASGAPKTGASSPAARKRRAAKKAAAKPGTAHRAATKMAIAKNASANKVAKSPVKRAAAAKAASKVAAPARAKAMRPTATAATKATVRQAARNASSGGSAETSATDGGAQISAT